MIIEQRTYRFKAGKIPTFMAIYQKTGLPIQERILGNLIGYFITEIGPLNETVHLWGYDTLNDRNERRANLGSNEEWMMFLNQMFHMFCSIRLFCISINIWPQFVKP